jgi:flagellar biosynthesis/type III secretory pathway protein FliH
MVRSKKNAQLIAAAAEQSLSTVARPHKRKPKKASSRSTPISLSMIKAALRPASNAPLLAVGWCRAMIRRTRDSTAKIVKDARKSAAKSCRAVRARAYVDGYSEGRKEAQKAFFTMTGQAQSLAEDWRRQCLAECTEVAFTLAGEIIGAELRQRKETYKPWLRSALDILPSNDVLKLHYHPDQRSIVSDLVTDYRPSIDLIEDSSLPLGEISLRSTSGGVDFSWRHALDLLRESLPSKG